nr:hypothetical protein [Tanacetum cinerariifolium]
MRCLPRSACLGSLSSTQSLNSLVLGEGLEIQDNHLCLWVIRGSQTVSDTILKHVLCKLVIAKVPTAITNDGIGSSKPSKERFQEFSNNSGVVGGERFRFNPFRQVIDVGNKMHKAFSLLVRKFLLPEGTSHCLKMNATVRRIEMPLPEVCTAIEEKKKKLSVKDRWQLH